MKVLYSGNIEREGSYLHFFKTLLVIYKVFGVALEIC